MFQLSFPFLKNDKCDVASTLDKKKYYSLALLTSFYTYGLGLQQISDSFDDIIQVD